MSGKRWVRVWFIIIAAIPVVGVFNYAIDPYGIYKTNYFKFEKIKRPDKIRLVKVIDIRKIKPKSIVLGTSRAEYGYDPVHSYFIKPSYNLANSSSSMYENGLNFKLALRQGRLKQVLLVADYRMFNSKTMKTISDFDDYIDKSKNIYSYLFSVDALKDGLATVIGTDSYYANYMENGQLEHFHNQKQIDNKGGHLNVMNLSDAKYYKDTPVNYVYADTGKNSFDDFEVMLALCYENNIKLDVVFGPSHIRQWESLNYYLGYDKWLQWKKDVVLSVDKIAKKYNRNQYRIFDFSVYHQLTSEKVPDNKNDKMKYHWESSHYKNELGNIVLDRLNKGVDFNDFGVELSVDNIDEHLRQQEINREKFIDTRKWQHEVFF